MFPNSVAVPTNGGVSAPIGQLIRVTLFASRTPLVINDPTLSTFVQPPQAKPCCTYPNAEARNRNKPTRAPRPDSPPTRKCARYICLPRPTSVDRLRCNSTVCSTTGIAIFPTQHFCRTFRSASCRTTLYRVHDAHGSAVPVNIPISFICFNLTSSVLQISFLRLISVAWTIIDMWKPYFSRLMRPADDS